MVGLLLAAFSKALVKAPYLILKWLMDKLLILLFLVNFSLNAESLCDANGNRCEEIGSGAPWMLSILETSLSVCAKKVNGYSQVEVWLKNHDWLLPKVKAMTSEYENLIKMQKKSFWHPDNPEILKNCKGLLKLVQSDAPLSSSYR
jgi:hypothetical protein